MQSQKTTPTGWSEQEVAEGGGRGHWLCHTARHQRWPGCSRGGGAGARVTGPAPVVGGVGPGPGGHALQQAAIHEAPPRLALARLLRFRHPPRACLIGFCFW
ncbi:hypothetical protein F751_1543 [Auxenochlorella protothecoides]|uniref:Uncharacterized protein n=1 Tax=Auxenochlorella protothecoides TaxID=3075 RepID=A0A087SRB0_AUXPR|nr:hypothetical protein F751_1543 [Auxenochlorella protothecoides]KFM28264.1 hypothetical protein F751_1543 [Auxenochlorella protothecoides]